MITQPLEFCIGYAFGDIQRRFFKLYHEHKYLEDAELVLDIPKCWFEVKNPTRKDTMVKCTDSDKLIARTCETLELIFPEWNVSATTEVNNQYQQFKFKFEKKIVRQQMTIKDIEEILGYPIEIVAENK